MFSLPKKSILTSNISLVGYNVGETIGIGTYGEVRCGQRISDNMPVAIKIVDLTHFREETVQRLKKEISILQSLQHNHIISILEVVDQVPFCGTWCSSCACTNYQPLPPDRFCKNCLHDRSYHSPPDTRLVTFVVQELAVGGEFWMILSNGALPEDICRLYFRQLIEGIEYCHKNGIIHRDLKLENIVLNAKYDLVIIDFGLASFGQDSSRTLHSTTGSMPYSAPEVFYNKELYGGRGYLGEPADIWSCAVILFTFLTGRPPFRRPLTKTYNNHLQRDKFFIRLLQGDYPEEISREAQDLFRKMFTLDSEYRITLEAIKQSDWYNGHLPDPIFLRRVMCQRARKAWETIGKGYMIEYLHEIEINSPLHKSLIGHSILEDILELQLTENLPRVDEESQQKALEEEGEEIENSPLLHPITLNLPSTTLPISDISLSTTHIHSSDITSSNCSTINSPSSLSIFQTINHPNLTSNSLNHDSSTHPNSNKDIGQ